MLFSPFFVFIYTFHFITFSSHFWLYNSVWCKGHARNHFFVLFITIIFRFLVSFDQLTFFCIFFVLAFSGFLICPMDHTALYRMIDGQAYFLHFCFFTPSLSLLLSVYFFVSNYNYFSAFLFLFFQVDYLNLNAMKLQCNFILFGLFLFNLFFVFFASLVFSLRHQFIITITIDYIARTHNLFEPVQIFYQFKSRCSLATSFSSFWMIRFSFYFCLKGSQPKTYKWYQIRMTSVRPPITHVNSTKPVIGHALDPIVKPTSLKKTPKTQKQNNRSIIEH